MGDQTKDGLEAGKKEGEKQWRKGGNNAQMTEGWKDERKEKNMEGENGK